jgi:hypothetical protein
MRQFNQQLEKGEYECETVPSRSGMFLNVYVKWRRIKREDDDNDFQNLGRLKEQNEKNFEVMYQSYLFPDIMS